MERAKESVVILEFLFRVLVGRKINLWTKVSARSFSRDNFSFAFQENGEKVRIVLRWLYQRAFIALALIVSIILVLSRPFISTKRKKKATKGEIKRYSRVRHLVPLYRWAIVNKEYGNDVCATKNRQVSPSIEGMGGRGVSRIRISLISQKLPHYFTT